MLLVGCEAHDMAQDQDQLWAVVLAVLLLLLLLFYFESNLSNMTIHSSTSNDINLNIHNSTYHLKGH